jgi:hypothetical protein
VWNKENNNYKNSKIEYIVSNPEFYKKKGLNLYYDFDNKRYAQLGGGKTGKLLFSYWRDDYWVTHDTLSETKADINEIKKYHQIEPIVIFKPTDNKKLIREGLPDLINNPLDWRIIFKTKKSGPVIIIYQIKI